MLSLPFTSVVSLHTNEYGCGVAKFSKRLAEQLGVPFVALNGDWGTRPLLSLKWSELSSCGQRDLRRCPTSPHGVFWHDAGDDVFSKRAEVVFYADPSLGEIGLWCPSLLTPSQPRTVRLFSFGMAHKLQTDKYTRVRELLDAAGKRYHLRVSVGLHEGTDLSDATKHFDALKDIMGPENVTILGILSDDAVSEELHNADYVLAFFEKGLRANNTTVHAALEHECRVITNFDRDSPTLFDADVRCINETLAWPRRDARHTWDQLIAAMRKECDKSRLAPAR